MTDDKFWMEKAYNLALKAMQVDEVPVGAVIVDEYNNFIAGDYNRVLELNDPTAHAEILAIRKACEHLKNERLVKTTIYVTLEPCCMCAGALVNARIGRVVFATRDFKTGACGSKYNICRDLINDEGIMQAASALLLQEFFQKKR